MNWKDIKSQLEHILKAPIKLSTCSFKEWESNSEKMKNTNSSKSIVTNHEVLFYLNKEGSHINTLSIEALLISESERQLVEMMIDAYHIQGKKLKALPSEEERRAAILKDWIREQLEKNVSNKELPESFASESSLFSAKVPLLLYGDYSDNRKVGYTELKKLLESFFEMETILIPLQDKEWLILCSDSLLDSDEEDRSGFPGNECQEDALESICLGLYELMVSEGIGECHISIYYPVIPAQSLLSAVLQLRESISLGRTYHVGNNIHLPWKLYLESVLNVLPDEQKKKISEIILKSNDYILDAETLMTLSEFFELDCNVSETAKKLYIHRNTLLYRLDKFKQETGLDVRNFSDAVLVKISLLLYKVTKRK